MYKEILKWVIGLISQPTKAWHVLSKREENHEAFLSGFIYPLIGLVTIAAFAGVLFTMKQFDLERALKEAIRTLVSSFGGFYLGAYLMNEIWQGVFKRKKDLRRWMRFVGYSSSLMFMLHIVLKLLPEFFFLKVFVFYTFYIIWEGAVPYMKVEETNRMKFSFFTTVVVVFTPIVIESLMGMFMPGLG